jgi:hypothetical protein
LTRYGVPGSQAELFEEIFQREAPDLFQRDPKLLFKLCTMISPAKLTEGGVKVVRALQNPGEFVVTFPQAYHGGFSHGFNCSEAVNFALPGASCPHTDASISNFAMPIPGSDMRAQTASKPLDFENLDHPP